MVQIIRSFILCLISSVIIAQDLNFEIINTTTANWSSVRISDSTRFITDYPDSLYQESDPFKYYIISNQDTTECSYEPLNLQWYNDPLPGNIYQNRRWIHTDKELNQSQLSMGKYIQAATFDSAGMFLLNFSYPFQIRNKIVRLNPFGSTA